MQQDRYLVYLFGSIIDSNAPNDIDVLVIYDSNIHHPKIIHEEFMKDKAQLYFFFKKPIHCTFLNTEEYKNAEKIVNCRKILIEKDANNCFNLTNWTGQFAG